MQSKTGNVACLRHLFRSTAVANPFQNIHIFIYTCTTCSAFQVQSLNFVLNLIKIIEIVEKEWEVPEQYGEIVPLYCGKKLKWKYLY